MTTFIETTLRVTTGQINVDLRGIVNGQSRGVAGVQQFVNNEWEANTTVRYNAGATARLRVFSDYTGTPTSAIAGFGDFTLENPAFWFVEFETGLGFYALLNPYTSIVTAATGSSDCIFSNESSELAKFTIVPGDLSTEECANGGYDEVCIKTIFTQLKNYVYSEDIFGQIRDKFAAFYSSIALEQRIVDSIKRLTERLLAGEINLDQFNELVKIDEQIFAGQFAKDYVTNYVKLQENIEKYKYLLT